MRMCAYPFPSFEGGPAGSGNVRLAIVLMSVCPFVDRNIENTNNQLKYAVIRSGKGIVESVDSISRDERDAP